MTLPDTTRIVGQLPRELRASFAPLVKHALGLGIGVVCGLLFFAAAFAGIGDPEGEATVWVWVAGQSFLPGYEPTLPGALAGAGWGFAAGFIAGWLLAFLRNGFLSFWVAVVGARERLRASRDFLDEF